MAEEQEQAGVRTTLSETLRELPLLDDLFLAMQALNIELVDDHLKELETDLLRKYIELERTPTADALFVSALSQMWVFAVYELLRTWRERAREIINWAQSFGRIQAEQREDAIARKRAEIERRAAEAGDVETRWQLFERATDEAFVSDLRSALDRAEVIFHRVEAVRVTLAKHEIPRSGRAYATAAGYARIDTTTGSMQWSIELGRNETELTSRRELADQLRTLGEPNERILPVAVQEKVATMKREGYGLNRVTAVLADGGEVPGVRVLWATEVVGVDGEHGIPFQVADVVDVRPNPRPEPDEGDAAAPF